jgi:hypothetical protein
VHEELSGASAARDRSFDHSSDGPTGASESLARTLDGCAELRIVFGRRGQAELELGLYQRNCVCVRRESQRLELRDRVRDGEVGQIEGDDVDRVRHGLDVQLGEVDALEVDHAQVLAQRAEQLPVPGVDRVHAPLRRSAAPG